MWLIPIFLLGVALYASAKGRKRGEYGPSSPALTSGAPTSMFKRAMPNAPTPLAVLSEFARIGQDPPPQVILCAIAEAEDIGRGDVAADIVRIFVAPVVHAHHGAQAVPSHAAMPAAFAMPQPMRSMKPPKTSVPTAPFSQQRVYAPKFGSRGRGSCERRSSPRDTSSPRGRADVATSLHEAMPVLDKPSSRFVPSLEELQRMLDLDPQAAIAQVTLNVIEKAAENPEVLANAAGKWGMNKIADDAGIDRQTMAEQALVMTAQAVADQAGVPLIDPKTEATIEAIAYGIAKVMHTPMNQLATEATRIMQTPVNELAAEAEAHRQATQARTQMHAQQEPPAMPTGFPTYDQWYEAIGRPSGMPYQPPRTASPLVGVSDEAWAQFCDRLLRESPTFQSARHVGQYRQRRERLAELGFDPNVVNIVGSPDAQRAALDADVLDAYRQASDEDSMGGSEGLVKSNVNRRTLVPGREEPVAITLSGVLGVIQAAGLEGAVGWFGNPRDRKRFPHTTQAFLRCNGVF